MLPQLVVIGNQKGGAGKTSTCTQLGGLCALAGWRVLAVDLDPQGNLARHLGVIDRSDDGRNLFDAVTDGVPLEPLRDVRPGLDLVAGGERWDFAVPRLGELAGKGAGLEAAISKIADDYDLILLDLPPYASSVFEASLLMGHYLLVVSSGDPSSIDGLRGTFRSALELRNRPGGNPHLEVLGVVLFGVPVAATAWNRRVRTQLGELLGEVIPMFDTGIRGMAATAASLQERGLLVTEGEEAAEDDARRLFERLQGRRSATDDETSGKLVGDSVSGLASDYLRLTQEFQRIFTERQAAYAQEVTS